MTIRESSPTDRPPVLAIIPHYGATAETVACVDSLFEAEYTSLHILIVDNSGNLVPDEFRTQVEVLVPGHNVGYCRACNIGIERAIERGIDYVLFVNNDTRTPQGTIEALVDTLAADSDAAGVGPLLTTQCGDCIWSAGSFFRFGPNEVRQRGLGRPLVSAPPYPDFVDFLPGAFALYKTADLGAIGGLDEDYFMYLDDADLGVRLKQRGRRLLYLPWVQADHGGSLASGGGVTPLRKFLSGVNTPRLLLRAGSIKLWVSFLAFDIIGLLPSILLHVWDPCRLRAQLAKGRGLVLGLRGYRAGPKDVQHYTAPRRR